jgi:hypothetical protein
MQPTCLSKYGNPQNIDLNIHDQERNLSHTRSFNVKTKMKVLTSLIKPSYQTKDSV